MCFDLPKESKDFLDNALNRSIKYYVNQVLQLTNLIVICFKSLLLKSMAESNVLANE